MELFKIIGLSILALVLVIIYWSTRIPDIEALKASQPERTAYMEEFAPQAITHQWIPLPRIPLRARLAVIAAEDGNFYRHNGIDVFEFKESWRKNWEERRFARGFSTITMQLARNLYLSSNKTLLRKFREILIARKIEQVLSKDRILELYLNFAEWGKGIFGIEAAARHYFGKSAGSLTAWEAAYLAAIIPNPVKWGRMPPGPYVQGRIEKILHLIGQ